MKASKSGRKSYLQLIRQFIRQLVVQYEYEASQLEERVTNMITEQEQEKIRLLSDTELYPQAVEFMRGVARQLPQTQINGLLNVSLANTYDELEEFIRASTRHAQRGVVKTRIFPISTKDSRRSSSSWRHMRCQS